MTRSGTAKAGTSPTTDLGAHDLEAGTRRFGEKALARVPDDLPGRSLDPESNSLAVLVRHLAGNMRFRWADLLTTDGEKPDRNRDSEFELRSPS